MGDEFYLNDKPDEWLECFFLQVSTVPESSSLLYNLYIPQDNELDLQQSANTNKIYKYDKNESEEMMNSFSCNICPFVSRYKGNLWKHLKIHSGERPFACNQCSYRGAQRTNLENHIKTKHTGEKPFACHLCSYRNVRRDRLKYHLFVKHNID